MTGCAAVSDALLDARALRRQVGTGADAFTLHLDKLLLRPGTCVAITGPSGCGKSTLLGLLSLALKPQAGDGALFSLGETDALRLWAARADPALTRLRRALIGFVPQTAALLPFLSLRRNVALSQELAGRSDPAWLDHLAEELGIAHVLDRHPAHVSVGQRQRAAVARALAHRPSVVLADEPTASVHPSQAERVMGLLAGLARRAGSALVAATHDPVRAQAAGLTVVPCAPDGPAASRFAFAGP